MHCCSTTQPSTEIHHDHNMPMQWKFLIPLISGIVLMFIPQTNIAVALGTLIIMIYSGGHYYTGAWKALKNKTSTMDTLVALGTGSAWLYSAAIILFPHFFPLNARHAYFDSALIVIALVDLGMSLEMKARGKTSLAIQKLLGLQPKTARVIRDGVEKDMPIGEIQVNDLIRVHPGEKIPVDGVITEGSSLIDESMLTGEAMPNNKKMGDKVTGGTLNKSGAFIFKATHIGKDTVLAHIIAMVEKAQQTKPQIGRLVDRITNYFVPIVVIVAIITFFVWLPHYAQAISTAMAVLLIACPCALGLATPISIMAGVGKAAEHGILIRNGDALQEAGNLTTIVLDKTGTITQGKPTLTDIIAFAPWSETHVLQYAASVEIHSEHPIAFAIVEAAKNKNISLLSTNHFNAISGQGVNANIEQHKVALRRNTTEENLTKQGKTVISLLIDDKLAGVLAVTDPIKENSIDAIRALKKSGLKVMMLTGDNKNTALSIAKQVGIDEKNVLAEVLPQDKAQQIKYLQQQHEHVGMVGDGINDAPALSQANVGFAIGTGTDIAIESADIALMSGSLIGVVNAQKISKQTLRNIKQNLGGSFIYNILGIPLAAGVFYPIFGWLLNPVFAAAAMAASSITVVLNANRLRLLAVSSRPSE